VQHDPGDQAQNRSAPGIGLGQVIPTTKSVCNAFIEPPWPVVDQGTGSPDRQTFRGFIVQFKGRLEA